MGSDDTLSHYRHREAEWAAECALDGVRIQIEDFSPCDAPALIDGVWDFVIFSCEEAEIEPPAKADATSILTLMIADLISESEG